MSSVSPSSFPAKGPVNLGRILLFKRPSPNSNHLYLLLHSAHLHLLSLYVARCSCLTVGNLPPFSPSFSVEDAKHQILQVTDVQYLGNPLGTTFTSPVYRITAASTPRRLVFMIRRSFIELSKSAFIPI